MPSDEGRLKPEKQKGQEHDFGLEDSLFNDEFYHRKSKKIYEQELKKEKDERKKLKQTINIKRREIEQDKKEFTQKIGK